MTEQTRIIAAIGLFLLVAIPMFLFERHKQKRREAAATPPPLPPPLSKKKEYLPTLMDENTFWSIIDSAVSHNKAESDYQYDQLKNRLRQMNPEEIVGFDRAMQQAIDKAYTVKLWGAAYLINGGCSDDGFVYFRGWLIAQGSTLYKQALADPDSLADYLQTYLGSANIEDEDLLMTPGMIFEEKVGAGEVYDVGLDLIVEPAGENWDFNDMEQMKRRLPKLFAFAYQE